MRPRIAALSLLCAVVLAVGLQVQPAGAGSVSTSISLSTPGPTRTAQAMSVTALLNSSYGPVANAVLHFSVGGRTAKVRTNGGGRATLRMRRNLAPGYYTVTVTYNGSGIYAPASASGTFTVLPLSGTTLKLILPSGPVKAGQAIVIQAILLSDSGPMRRTPVHLYFNGVKKVTLETNASGLITYRLHRNFPAGVWTVTAYYHGSRPRGLGATSATGTLTIQPLHLTLQALPGVAGVSLAIDGRVYKTDASGAIHLDVASAGFHSLTASNASADPRIRLTFVRWSTGSGTATTRYHMLADETVYASFAMAFLTHVQIVDADGRSVQGPDLGQVTAVGPRGSVVQLWPSTGDQWLTLPPPSRTALAGTPNDWHYSITSATYDGLSVANRGDSAFVPGPGKTWQVRLRLYTLSVHVRRPLVGPPHTSVLVISQNGLGRSAAIDSSGYVILRDLPRGEYTVKVIGPGYSLPVATTMSRSQTVEVLASSPQEFVVAYEVAVIVVILFVLLARRRWLAQRRLGSPPPS
jgi:hypothetical protein